MGFYEAEFLGLKDNYKSFMQDRKHKALLPEVLKLNNDCIPDYKIAGGKCNDTCTNLEDVSFIILNRREGTTIFILFFSR